MTLAQRSNVDFFLVKIWDYLLVFLIVANTALGTKFNDLVLMALILPLVTQFFLSDRSAFPLFKRPEIAFVGLAFPYLIWHYFVASSYPLNGDPIEVRMIELPGAWGVAIAILALVFWRFSTMQDIKKVWRVMAPLGLLAAFLVLSLDYFTDFRGDECRVSGYVFNPVVPPVFFTIFTIGSFLGWRDFSKQERLIRYALVLMAVVVSTGYTGARMMLLVQILTFGVLALLLPVSTFKERAKIIGVLGGMGVAGVIIGLGVDFLIDCTFGERLRMMAETAGEASEPGKNSITIRFDLARTAWAEITQNPWTGFGIAIDKQISAPYYHTHNQYFSWMLWGGVVSLITGLGFMIAPSIGALQSKSRDGLMLAMAVTGVIGLNFLSDSLLYHEFVVIEYSLCLGLFFALGRRISRRSDKEQVLNG